PAKSGSSSASAPSGSPSKTSSKTARRISAWSLLDTGVVSAHRYSARGVVGLATVTASANRSPRPLPPGKPARRMPPPNGALTSARSARSNVGRWLMLPSADHTVLVGLVILADQRAETGSPHGREVL